MFFDQAGQKMVQKGEQLLEIFPQFSSKFLRF